MRLIDGNKLFTEVANNEDMERSEKVKILTMISEQETALSVTELITKVGGLDIVGINGVPHVSLKDVLKIINGGSPK